MNSIFHIDSQTHRRDIITPGNLNITQNSPPEDVLKVIQAIQQKVGELDIGDKDKRKISNHLDNAITELKDKEPDKKSIEESIKSANGILKEAKATGETLKEIGVMVGNDCCCIRMLLERIIYSDDYSRIRGGELCLILL